MIGSSVAGARHALTNSPCQDAHGYLVRNGYVIAAVADGLGTAPKSEVGSRLAVDAVISEIEQLLGREMPDSLAGWMDVIRVAFGLARIRIEEVAEAAGEPLRDYGTTLLAAVLASDWLAIGHLGDGAAVALHTNGSIETVSPPLRGEYANEVVPLTAPGVLRRVRTSARRADLKAVALLTDGIQDLSIESGTESPHIRFFDPLFEAVSRAVDVAEASRQLEDFLVSERVCERTNDDKTLLLIGRVEDDFPPPYQSQVEEL